MIFTVDSSTVTDSECVELSAIMRYVNVTLVDMGNTLNYVGQDMFKVNDRLAACQSLPPFVSECQLLGKKNYYFFVVFRDVEAFCETVDFLRFCKRSEENCSNVCPYNLVTSWSSVCNSFPLQLVQHETLVNFEIAFGRHQSC